MLYYFTLFTLAAAAPAAAYIGPGAGLGAISVAVAIVLGVILLLVGFLWYPLKRMLKGNKAKSEQSGAESDS